MSVSLSDLHSIVDSAKEEVVAWRRHLHQNPELSFEEEKTSQFVYDTLLTFSGLEVSRPTKTSVLATLKGAYPGPVLAIRADMDALPITEENSFDFVSNTPGKMHACGHDGHTAMLLGTAKILTQFQDQMHGEVRFIFQHAEELFPGGAQEIVDAGVMEGVQSVIGIHLWSPLEVGKIAIRSGPFMAAPDTFYITIRGKGGHAAQPQRTVDPVVIAAQVVTNLQHIVSRNMDPLDPVVLSITQFHAGTAHNIIPEKVELNGTVRSFKAELRSEVPRLMEQIVKGVTEAHGATYEFTYEQGYRPVVNDADVTEQVREILLQTFGEDVVIEGEQHMGGEDFSAYQQAAPGTFFNVGAGNAGKGIVYPHHHPKFTIDEDSLPIGVEAFINIVLKTLGE
ncbi:M20 family metallopeptidase [Alicyclobacillus fastidiosus]|uniref:M20 family metallopeptidase n=1 Tax=Alicyclobacillus fastidiosus TaxID=392011 RepID=A0ABY6ZPF6_9BACL|nr:M20 family metallopeptidase [Alicyclobacillus fastidiosus]WAH43949.1 M20 family metallopeptidase [Alicyclobacillus fastidiosus]GMA60206.1 N-acyl-L-amino acid amidohydrolase [Alicyclobacillus fastidiosus]